MKTAIDLSVLFLVLFGITMVFVGIYFKADVLGLASVVSALAILNVLARSLVFRKHKTPEGRGLHATHKMKAIK